MSDDERVFIGRVPLRGRLRVPGDKSISHRALLFAALAHGPCRISNLASGADVAATLTALQSMAVRTSVAHGVVTVRGGGAESLAEPGDVVDCGNSGTAIRLGLGVVAGRPFLSILTGDTSLRRRPMGRVVEPLRRMGASIDGRDGGTHAPIVVRGTALHSAHHVLPVASAQLKSALVLAALQAKGETIVTEPGASRDHTERMLAALGAPLEVRADGIHVRAGAPDAFDVVIPGDPSSAAFFAVAAAVSVGSDIVLEGVGLNPGRTGFIEVLKRMGADIDVTVTEHRLGEPVGEIAVRAAPLSGTVIGGDEIPRVLDELPVLAVAAAHARGTTEVRDAAELRVKESDRIGAISQELEQLGVGVETWADGFAVRGGAPRAGVVKSHGDHRIAMAGAIAGLTVDGETTVRGWDCVATSYPEFTEHLAILSGEHG